VALSSALFTSDGPGKQRLADCAKSHAANFYVGKPPTPGTEDAVRRIQHALRSQGFSISDPAGVYGQSTAKAVFAFKNAHRPPILGPGQTVPDGIVGIKTIAALDDANNKKPPGPMPPGPTPPAPPKPLPPPKPIPPPPPRPKSTDVAWKFTLVLAADIAGFIRFNLRMTDPESGESDDLILNRTGRTFKNSLGVTVDCNQTGTLMLPFTITLDAIRGSLANVGFVPVAGSSKNLRGNLLFLRAEDDSGPAVNASAAITGTARQAPALGGSLIGSGILVS
jgi:peptidoglycan hydrolase-like protein with peptidoglycan-binding domain